MTCGTSAKVNLAHQSWDGTCVYSGHFSQESGGKKKELNGTGIFWSLGILEVSSAKKAGMFPVLN